MDNKYAYDLHYDIHYNKCMAMVNGLMQSLAESESINLSSGSYMTEEYYLNVIQMLKDLKILNRFNDLLFGSYSNRITITKGEFQDVGDFRIELISNDEDISRDIKKTTFTLIVNLCIHDSFNVVAESRFLIKMYYENYSKRAVVSLSNISYGEHDVIPIICEQIEMMKAELLLIDLVQDEKES